MAFDEEAGYLMLSGIQHFQFCRRQWALIHIEQQWEENVRTIEGQHLHQKADQPFLREKRRDKLVVRAMPVQSRDLRISGICDVVEFIQHPDGIELDGETGKYAVYPVEYKRGKPKANDADVLQLTAQAMCLEEMLLCEIPSGYLFYNEIKRRVEVPITKEYRNKVRAVVEEMHDYYHRRHTPKVKTGAFCNSCSLQQVCLPKLMAKRSVKSYIEGRILE
ncbi:CRISPR-associated protein Cas4 [Pseudobacillus badius]|uniref:CRISPR-associated protein Cas4 n=1 Tax=Bacillus badius TaxID=1455 RepID=UPI0007B05B56|nr:CRISPR-associated protein Cas4 [Bacillus badius]KZO00175.1 CRISPR-associated protein Cas4 [Bacillus badius]OCS86337.1 CRISPR-associated protein Cas4 [Bacillus badius]OVE52202.1 CRISPR-associated protein Cas4 [Bacillus badius]TDW03917.1 CRISPR-associated Cas4 family exonuclease [Bacillus badius]